MVMKRFAFIIAIDDKTRFRHIENYQGQETSSLRDDKIGERGRPKRRPGREAGASRIFFRRGGATKEYCNWLVR